MIVIVDGMIVDGIATITVSINFSSNEKVKVEPCEKQYILVVLSYMYALYRVAGYTSVLHFCLELLYVYAQGWSS